MSDPQFHVFDSNNPIPRDQVAIVARDICGQLPNHKIGNYLETKPHVLADSEFLSLISVEGTYVGVASGNMYRFGDREFFYVETMLLGESLHDRQLSYAQIGALFRCMIRARGEMPSLVACKTYNARAYVLIRNLAQVCGARVYPTLGAPNFADLEELACEVAQVISPGLEFEARYGVVRGGGGAVAPDFWPSQPLTRSDEINDVFTAHLSSQDRMLCVIDTRDPAVKRRIAEMFAV